MCLFSGLKSKAINSIIVLRIAKGRKAWWFKKNVFVWSKSWQTVSQKLSRPGGRWEVVASVTAVMQILSYWGQSVERGLTAACWQNIHRMLPPAFLPNLFWPFSFMAFHKMHFTGHSFTGRCREISIYIIFNSLQWVLLPTHQTTCFYKENTDIRMSLPTYGTVFSWRVDSVMVQEEKWGASERLCMLAGVSSPLHQATQMSLGRGGWGDA